ncbi:MAG: helix-turn-helix domain-containing protein [Clostridia bacterium]|nr:helix-turn-helix domain-containing protein [Clostridia bacterium]
MKLSENLKIIRRDNNLSQEQLAEKLGVSRQAVSKWESGQSYPEMDKVLLICKLFNYNIDELMNENVKVVEETKESTSIVNKYAKDFFSFITKTIDMFSSMKFKQKLKCIIEECFMFCLIFLVFLLIGAVGDYIANNVFGTIFRDFYYYGLRNILEAIYIVFSIIAGTTVFLHIFKIRYLDYYEIVKENVEDSESIKEEDKDKEIKEDKDNKKIFVEKKKERVIIRDPNHSSSKFLNGLFNLVLAFIKFVVICLGLLFVFTFVSLCTLLVLSMLFIKTGMLFVGTVLLIIALLIANFVILEILYDFIVNRKFNKVRVGVLFLVSLIITGISIGLILIGFADFEVIENNDNTFTMSDEYVYKMKEDFAFNTYNCAYRYIETDIKDVKIVVNYTKYAKCYVHDLNHGIEIYCGSDELKTIDLIKQIIKDINNKQIKDYPYVAEVHIYASKENIEKIQENNDKRISNEYEIQRQINENENLRDKIERLQNTIDEQKEEINNLRDTIRQYEMAD